MTLDDFLPFVLPKVRLCPPEMATFEVLNAIVELCEEGLVWRAYQDEVLTVDDQTAYAYAPADGQRVHKLLSMTLAGDEVDVVDPGNGKKRDAKGVTTNYAYGDLAGFELRPVHAEGLAIVTYSAVAPTLDATVVPDDFRRYAEKISFGALARLLAAPKADWADPRSADTNQGRWDAAVSKAKTDAARGFARAPLRATSSWF